MAKRRSHRKRTHRATRRRKTAVAYAINPKRRARRRKSYASNRPRRRPYRRNPNGITTGFLMDAAYVTGGFIGTRVVSNMVLPMFPMVTTMPIMRIIGKGAVAWGVGFLGGMMLGRRVGAMLMVGGFVEVLDDAVKTYIAPFAPMLADGNQVGSYVPLSSYPTLSGPGDYSPYGVYANMGAGEYSSDDAV